MPLKAWTSKKFWNSKWWILSISWLKIKKTKIADRMVVEAPSETMLTIVTSLAMETKKDQRMPRMRRSKVVTTQEPIRWHLSRLMVLSLNTKASEIRRRNRQSKIMVISQINFYHTIRSTRCKHMVAITTKYLSCRIRKDQYRWVRIVVKIVIEAMLVITFSSKLIN